MTLIPLNLYYKNLIKNNPIQKKKSANSMEKFKQKHFK